jgi:hypothetical protein
MIESEFNLNIKNDQGDSSLTLSMTGLYGVTEGKEVAIR